jgi:hypothetical protein
MRTSSSILSRHGRAFLGGAKTFCAALAFLSLALPSIPSEAANVIHLHAHTKTVTVPAGRHKGVVVVPIRTAFQKLGATVNFSSPPSLVEVQRRHKSVLTLHVGSRRVYIFSKPALAAIAPYEADNRVVIPLSLVKQVTKAAVTYIPEAHVAHLSQRVVKPVVVHVAPVVVHHVVPVATVPVREESPGMPWWVWIPIILLVLGLLAAYLLRLKRPIIHTSGTEGS